MERDRWLAVVLRTALLVLFFWMIRGIAVPIIMGALFALLLSPLLGRIEPRLGKYKSLAPLLLTISLLVLVVIPFVFVAVEAVSSINQFITRDWSSTITRVQTFLRDGIDIRGRNIHIGSDLLQSAIQNVGQRAATYAAAAAGAAATALPEILLDVFLFGAAVYYFLRDGEPLVRWMFRLSPFQSSQTRELFQSVRATVNGAILGILVTALVQGGLTMLSLYLFKVPNAFLLGIVATLLSFIPLLGTTPVTLGATIYLFVIGHIGSGVGMGIAAVIIGLSDNVVRPWAQRSRSTMHPLVTLLGIFGGLDLFGAVGVFLGPVIAAMAVWTIQYYAKVHADEPKGVLPPVEPPVLPS